MESSFTGFLLKVLCKLQMAAWSLILQAEVGEIVELGLQSSSQSSEEIMAGVLIESRSDSLEGRGCWLWIGA